MSSRLFICIQTHKTSVHYKEMGRACARPSVRTCCRIPYFFRLPFSRGPRFIQRLFSGLLRSRLSSEASRCRAASARSSSGVLRRWLRGLKCLPTSSPPFLLLVSNLRRVLEIVPTSTNKPRECGACLLFLKLTLRPLWSLASLAKSWLLTLLGARVAGKKTCLL